ncbi:FAD:protein FMN transferase [Mycobacteroides abscessus]|nr:FAD:protein FMN transferase [Mycobacteroides abscessus]PVA43233.1 FAD:protein FMN transferase [Mycobacteroides abscessus]RIQ79437.1 FAD:protein FMN transferase [Mycobacteroides abscessus]RIR05409.1 FAD:protein FMN transferase [Mycobacteroides abscessus]RIS17134.1 FAD:protein FMN transferase [Mycobacteroides abscessus]
MGADAQVLIVGADPALLSQAQHRIVELESRWSRFRPDSELARLNNAAGAWISVSADTAALLRTALRAWTVTGGLFDPSVLAALERAGYDRSFETISPTQPRPARTAATPAPGCAGIEITGDDRVRLPAGVRIDLGGVGKGYAADLVAGELLAAGAAGACVNLGGDVRVAGQAPDPAGWGVAVADEHRPGTDAVWVGLADGAVATSTRLRRRWERGGARYHHLIAPATGAPADGPIDTVTVIAAHTHWAEILAKAALIAGPHDAMALLQAQQVAALLITEDGQQLACGNWERYVTWTPPCRGTSPAPAG